jgi:dCTP deaminase
MAEKSGVLSDTDIKHELIEGNVVIQPFNENLISNSSVDVTLGRNYYRSTKNNNLLVNPWNEQSMVEYWEGPFQSEITTDSNILKYLSKNDKDSEIIILNPRETILGHTNEFIGGRNSITTMMKARSSMGRSNIGVCKCAGWGDIGYINRWTMEITNFSDNKIILIFGKKIAQIVFFYSSEPSKKYLGKYQQSDSISNLIKTWTPENMLPKAYND